MANNNQPPGPTDLTAQKNAFTRKKGTFNNVGYAFEKHVTVFKLFELIRDDSVKDFQISTNDENLGCFDDIAISVEYKNGTTRKSALQLKHVDNEEKLLQIEDLCWGDKKFSIARYCLEAQEIKETDFVYILHTNRKLVVNDQEIKLQFKLPKKNNLELTVQLCKTGPEHIYTFQIVKGNNPKLGADDFEAYQRFFQKFHLKTNQDNVQKLLNKNLEKWIDNFGGTRASFDKFNEFIKRWSTRDGDLEKLDKKIVIFKLVESLLSPYIEKLIFSEHENDQVVRILREAIMKFSVTTFKTRNEFVKKMWLNTKSDTEIKKVGCELYLLDEKQEFMDPSDKMKILWHLGECPLIVKVFKESEKAINTAIGFLAKNEIIDRKLILQGKACYKKNHEITLNRFEKLSDLKNMDATIYKNIVTKLQLHLHGRQCNLGEIITSEDAEKILTTDYLIEMAQSNIKVCGEQESLPEFYVRRSLSRTVINPEFLKKTKSQDIIVISNSKEEASEIKTTAGKIAKIEELLNVAGPWHQLSEKCIVIQPSESTSEEFLSIRQNFPEKKLPSL